MDAEALNAAIAAFERRGLPLGYARPPAASRLTPLSADSRAEAALWHPTAIMLTRYFQARTLSEARAALMRAGAGRAPSVVVAPDPVDPLALSGLSPAGLRCAYLVPGETMPSYVESHPARLVAARGGHIARLGAGLTVEAARAAAARYLADAAGDPFQVHATIYLDLSGPAKSVAELAEALADDVATRDRAGHVVMLAPSELGVRHAQGFERLIALRLDPGPGAAADDAALVALASALSENQIAFSVSRDDPDDLGPADCIRIGATAIDAGKIPGGARGGSCAVVDPPDPAAAPLLAEAGLMAAMGAGDGAFRGLDGNALLHLGPAIRVSSGHEVEDLLARLTPCEDVVISVATEDFKVPVQRNTLVAAFRRLNAVPGSRIVDLAEFARLVGASDPIAETLRRTRTLAPEIASRPAAPPAPAERAALMGDARLAWSYFKTVSHENTGLPETTVAFNANGSVGTSHDMLTQWDAGSAIFAWIAARDLGLITPEAFAAWSDKVIAALATSTLPGPRLPRAIFHAGTPWIGDGNFNVCDAGRLLTALKALETRRPAGDTAVRDLVGGWDIAAAVINGIPHSFERGRFVAMPESHCSSYIKRGFGLWGIKTQALYDVYDRGATAADAAMHLLWIAADIGTLGAEPLLMEALEHGIDAKDRVLIDVLLAAQIDEWRATGKLIAPSEGPMERPPWFTYQGLRIDRTGPGRWDVMTLAPGGDTPTPAFRAEARMVTSKAAFLWAAAHPHAYCDRLVDYVRNHGKMVHGFVSGTYTATDTPTLNYGDVNTNGVILEAIAARLGVQLKP